jgi:N-acetyl-anhydromuramyl-L-alanine amidase AmpD
MNTREALAFAGNYGSRGTHMVDTVIIHTTEGSLSSAVSWFGQDHKPSGQGASSAHYVVGKDGEVVQCVAEGDCAYHAGHFGVNLRSIGIECEGHAADPATWTPELLEALLELCEGIVRRHGVPVQRTSAGPGFAGHADVPDPTRPGRFGGAGGHTDPGHHFPWIIFLDRLTARLTAAPSEVA